MTDNSTDEYFNQAWPQIDCCISVQEEARINETIAMIPEDCSSILDLGCGDGRITNRLIGKFDHVCGLDSSEERLKYVISEKKLGNLDSLPFADESYDLILCSLLLEHLSFQTYPKAIYEIQRVAKKYILVTVPNNKNRKLSAIVCPYCGCKFDDDRDIRSYDQEEMRNLFDRFRPRVIKPCMLIQTYPDFVFVGRRLLNPVLGNSFPDNTICPQCGYYTLPDDKMAQSNSTSKISYPTRLIRRMLKVLPKKEKGALLGALYVSN